MMADFDVPKIVVKSSDSKYFHTIEPNVNTLETNNAIIDNYGIPRLKDSCDAKSSYPVDKISPSVNRPMIKRNLVCENNSPIQLKYVIKEKIGEGTWGSVHIAVERNTGLQRAVKKVAKSKALDCPRFRGEISFLKKLDHPNIVKLYETFEDSANIYMVMEYCKGGELFDRVQSTSYFPETIAARITYQMLSAVCYIHSKGIVHRDLKLENFLFLTKEDTSSMKLIDFGLAKKYNGEGLMRTKVGTIYYVPPEVLKGAYNEKCDLWSIGVILHILLCGYPPFNGSDDISIIKKIKDGTVEFYNKAWKKVSNLAKLLVTELLNPNYDTRLSAQQALNHDWFQLFSKDSCSGIPRPFSTPENLNKLIQSNNIIRSASSAIKSKTHCCELSFVGLHSPLCSATRQFIKHQLQNSENPVLSAGQLNCWKNLAKQLISKWKKFAKQNQLKRAVLRVIAQHLNDMDVELQPLRQLFFMLDSGKDGTLSCEEVAAGIEAIQTATPTSLPKNLSHQTLNNFSMSSSASSYNTISNFIESNESQYDLPVTNTKDEVSIKDLELLLKAISLEKNHALEYSDFMAASIDQQHYLKDDVLKAAFCVFDKNGDGKIHSDEIKATLSWYGLCHFKTNSSDDIDQTNENGVNSISDQEIQSIMLAWDHDKDGTINYKDFVTSLQTDDD